MTPEIFIHGVRVPISANEVSPVILEALISGSYEAKEARLAARVMSAGDRVLELGAGIGVITTVMARTSNVRVWAFDANPGIVDLAQRVLEANGVENATVNHGLMISGEPGEHPFYVRADFWMSSMMEGQGPYDEIISIPSRNIDAFIAANNINVLVMDIEGAERELLAGAKLDGVEKVFLELHDHLYGLQGVRDIFRAMNDHGLSYDPRGSSGPCVLFTRDDGSDREYCPEPM